MSHSPSRRDLLKGAGALAAGLVPGARGQELRAGGAAPRRRPNILFFFPDQHRWDWTPANPRVPVPMPNLARIAERGVAFDRAFCAAPVCAPSRACLARGVEYDACGVPDMEVDFPRDRATLYRQLRDGGYTVLGCGKMDLAAGVMREVFAGRAAEGGETGLGLDGRRFVRDWGFSAGTNNAGKGAGALLYGADPKGPKDAYYAYLASLEPPQAELCADDMIARRSPSKDHQWGDTRPSPLAEEHYCDNWIARNGLALLEATPRGEPWFLQVNFAGPHPPMDITTRMERLYRGPDRVVDGFPQPHAYRGRFDEAHHVRIRQNYAAMIENIDRWLGLYLEAIAARGELEDTIIVYSSDHGEMLGDHGRWGKSIPHHSSACVPLVLAGPGIRSGHRSSALVSLIDLTATFLDYGAVSASMPLDGFSLRGLLEGRTDEHREYVLSGLDDWRLVFDGRHKLVANVETGGRRLFDLHEDPWEDRDVAAGQPEQVERLHRLLRAGSYRPAASG